MVEKGGLQLRGAGSSSYVRRGWYQLARNVDVASGCVGFAAPTVAVTVSLALGLVLCLSAFAIATAAHACASGATHGVTFKIPFSALN